MAWIQLYTNQAFDILEPDPSKIGLETIAVSLARTARFKGHTKGPVDVIYNNAQHSCLVAYIVQEPELKLPALLHDAHEVYSGFGDVATPAKQLNPFVKDYINSVHQNIDKAIASKFGFDPMLFAHPSIKRADKIVTATERRDVMGKCERPYDNGEKPIDEDKIIIFDAKHSYRMFLEAYNAYVTKTSLSTL